MSDTINCFNCGQVNAATLHICGSCGTPLLPESLGVSNEMKTQAIPSLDELLRKDRTAYDDKLSQQIPSLSRENPLEDVGGDATEALNYSDLIKAHPDFARLAELDQKEEATKLLDLSEMSAMSGLVETVPPASIVSGPGDAGQEEATKLLDLDQLGDLDALFDAPASAAPKATMVEGSQPFQGMKERLSDDLGTGPSTALNAEPELVLSEEVSMATVPASAPSKDNDKTIKIVVGVVVAFFLLTCFCFAALLLLKQLLS